MPLTIDTEQDENGQCPIRAILTTVMGKWSSLILLSLRNGSLRFSEIKRGVGDITQRVLTENLRALERDGYLTRTVVPGPPIEVHYELTDLGSEFVGHFTPLVSWALERRDTVLASRDSWQTK
ncbi:MAG: winged helix-turn-helix transcriptional regulator [Paracoccaceae bacterium]